MSESGQRLDRMVNLATAIAAITAIAILAWREFGKTPSRSAARTIDARPLTVAQRGRLEAIAFTGQAEVANVVAFSDIQCPFCARFDSMADSLVDAGAHLSYGMVHFPLARHSRARILARALECARAQSSFTSMRRILFARQAELDGMSVDSIALLAGLRDSIEYRRCITAADSDSLVEKGIALGKELGLRGTPMIVFDGYVLDQPPSATQLARMAAARAGGATAEKALREGGYRIAEGR